MASHDPYNEKASSAGQKFIFRAVLLVVALQSYIIYTDKTSLGKLENILSSSHGLEPVVASSQTGASSATSASAQAAADNNQAAHSTLDMPISFRVSGKVTQLFFSEHAEVKQGDILATLDTAILEDTLAGTRAQLQSAIANAQSPSHIPNPNFTAIEAARTNLDAAQHTYDNAHADLIKRGAGLRNALEAETDNVYLDDKQNDHDTFMALEKAQRELAQQEGIGRAAMKLDEAVQIAQDKVTAAEKNLAASQLVAPADGVVANRNIEAGDTVGPGTTVYVLSVTKKALPNL